MIKLSGIEGLSEDKAYFLPRGFDKVQTENQFEGARLSNRRAANLRTARLESVFG
ncbi:MAG: hypothetical protein ACR2HG_12300 [Pyrinomonadaceae bacterium]